MILGVGEVNEEDNDPEEILWLFRTNAATHLSTDYGSLR